MFWTIVALVMTVMMGGIIAYNGDLIGRKFGKRRVSLFGLRPKYTAILITSVTGVAISAITTGALFLLVPPVREVILEGEAAIAANARLRIKNGAQNQQIQVQNQQIQTTKQQYCDLQSAKDHLDVVLKKEKAQLSQVQAQLQPLQAQLQTARLDLAAAKTDLVLARNMTLQAQSQERQAHLRNTQLRRQNVTLAQSNQTLSDSNVALAQNNLTLTRENDAEAQKNQEYVRQNGELARQNETLVRDNEALTKQQSESLTRVKGLAERTTELSNDNAKLEIRNAKLEQDNQHLTAANRYILDKLAPGYENLSEALFASRNKRVVVHKDEDLARLVVPARSTPEAVRDAIHQLLHDASDIALGRGAGQGDQARAVQVVDRQFIMRRANGRQESVEVSGDDRIDAIVSRVAWQPVPTCLLAIAVTNSVEDEPAAVDLVPIPNRPIFTKGEEIAMHRVNAGEPVDRLFEDMVAFLKEMGQSALQQGMIPRMDPEAGPQVGSLNAAEVAKLVERVREFNGTVRIRALAADNIHSADPLALTFKIEP